MSKNENNQYKSAFKFLFKFMKPHKKLYLVAATFSILLIGTNILQTYATGMLINNSSIGNFKEIVLSIFIFTLSIAFNIALTYKNGYACASLSALSCKDIKAYIFNKLLNSKYSEFQKVKSGDMLNTINSDTTNVCNFVSTNLTGLFSQFAMAFAGLIYLLIVSKSLCFVTFAYTPIGMFFTLSLNKKLNKLYPKSADYKGESLSVVEQALSCIPVIKSFMMEKQTVKRVKAQYDNVYNTDMKISVCSALMQPACYTTSCIPRILYLIFGGYMVISSNLSIGTFIATFNLLDFIIGPTVYFPFLLNGLNKTITSINRINRLENLPQEDMQTVARKNFGKPSIKIHNLCFGYNEDEYTINNLNFEHNSSGIIALCGGSGSGKTTLLDLICGLYKPQKGKIELRGDIGVVSQDTYLFPTSVMENIKCAKIHASDEEVINAAKKAGADSFIKALSYGYDTMIGQGNNNLSGGQRQRISLARAMLKNAEIWLLDEPTSALDEQTESLIVDTMKKASKENLIIVAAHRKSLIDCADVILNLQEVSVQ
ncbi:MAG: ABC transporter ATP-binding protein [Clostridium sp.]|uniref:ABC transporter ATP-binding protein n=1 Tax=Clostridium sp. TaxID=1506 RepID=UPI003D6D768F